MWVFENLAKSFLKLTKESLEKMKMKLIVLTGLLFVFSALTAFAEGEKWFVIKDTDNACKVISSKEKIDSAVAGPFEFEQQAVDAVVKSCPKSTVEKLKEKAAEGIEKAKTEAEKLKTEVEKLKDTSVPGLETAKDVAEKLKVKAEEGVDKARELIKQHLPEGNK